MKHEISNWLPVLAPPSGGARRLRLALDDATHASARPAGFALAGACAGVIAVVLTVFAAPASRDFHQRIEGALAIAPAAVRVADGEAIAVASARPDVAVYWVVSRAPQPTDKRP